MKKSYIIILFFAFVIFMFSKSIWTTKTVMRNSYHFVIEDIDTTAKGNLIFYSNNHQINFSSFWVTKFDSIMVGDSVAKDSCDVWLRFYRLNEEGIANLISEQESIMLIGRGLFCD